MKRTTFEALFTRQLSDAYAAERAMLKLLPKLGAAAASVELREALGDYVKQTLEHRDALRRIFAQLRKPVRSSHEAALSGLLSDAARAIDVRAEAPVIDLSLVLAVRRLQHRQIAAYSGARMLADMMRKSMPARLLAQMREDELTADACFAKIGETIIADALAPRASR